jgi:hypothetical protein
MVTGDLAKPAVLPPPGEIIPGHLYTLKEVCRRMGWSAAAFRQARGQGLQVKYLGKRAYIFGTALIEFIQEVAKDKRR